MTVTDQIKIIDNKIKANQAQYDLDRLTAKISALSSGELRKYEYLTGEDLGYRPSVLEQTKFDYSPLGKVFNKGLDDKDDKKERLFKRLKNIEGKNEVQLKAIEDQGKKQLDAIKNINIGSESLKTIVFFSKINEKAKKSMNEIKIMDDWLDTAQLICTNTDGKTKYDFNNFTFPPKFTLKIYHHDLTLQETEDDQQELQILINKLNNDHNPKK